jgi:hypothetical protein
MSLRLRILLSVVTLVLVGLLSKKRRQLTASTPEDYLRSPWGGG